MKLFKKCLSLIWVNFGKKKYDPAHLIGYELWNYYHVPCCLFWDKLNNQ